MGASQAQLGHTHQDIQNIKYSLLSGTQRDASPTGQEANTSSGAWETTGPRRGQTQESTRPTEVPDGVEDPAESSNQAASKAKTAWDPRPGGSKKSQPTQAQGPVISRRMGLPAVAAVVCFLLSSVCLLCALLIYLFPGTQIRIVL